MNEDIDLSTLPSGNTIQFPFPENNTNGTVYEIPIYDNTNNYINKIIINVNLSNIKNLNNYPLYIYINL